MLSIPIKPFGKQRHNTARDGTRYTPLKTKYFESAISVYVKHYMRELNKVTLPEGTPVFLILYIYKTIPKTWSKKKKLLALEGKIRPTVKPDGSNVLKSIEDGMNAIAYADDRQIVDWVIRAVYGNEPKIVLEFKVSPEINDFINHIPKLILDN